MEKEKLITATLLNMKEDVIFLNKNSTKENYDVLVDKYNSVFVGENFNKVLSFEVAHFLNISNEQFNLIIETITSKLNMNLEGLYQIDSIKPNSPDGYYIRLF